MCGIFGFVDYTKRISKEKLIISTDTLYRRGPDNGGYSLIEAENYNIGFGHRRLSIVDLSDNGNQPFTYDDLVLVFNGEIYNHKNLKKKLIDVGYEFSSTSDTEVAIKCIHYYGIDEAIAKFSGMFSIGIYNSSLNRMYIIRDRLGVKPLYYSITETGITFSSEIKAILSNSNSNRVCEKSVALYLKYGFVPTPLTMWEDINKLESGTYLEFDLLTKQSKQKKYWSYKDQFGSPEVRDLSPIDELDKILNESVRLRVDADVEVGCFLSGGYDSSLTAAIMQKQSSRPIKTFTIGFQEGDFDESSYAAEISKHLGTEHFHYVCSSDYVKSKIIELPVIWDDPISDTSVFPTLLVSELARTKVKVALSSDGGDEVFGGYNVYKSSLNICKINKYIPLRKQIAFILRALSSVDKYFFSNISRKFRRLSKIIEADDPISVKRAYQYVYDDLEVRKICRTSHNLDISYDTGKGNLNDMLIDDLNLSHVDQLLTKVDRASMYSSLEAREPLLDLKLLEFAAKLDESGKINDGKGKYLLKQLAHRYIPLELLERPKQGFSIPIKQWLGSELSELIDQYFSEDMLSHKFFDQAVIDEMIERYKSKEQLNFKQLWTLLSFQIWYHEWKKHITTQ